MGTTSWFSCVDMYIPGITGDMTPIFILTESIGAFELDQPFVHSIFRPMIKLIGQSIHLQVTHNPKDCKFVPLAKCWAYVTVMKENFPRE